MLEIVEHVVSDCSRFAAHRISLKAIAYRHLAHENIVEFMLASTEAWKQAEKVLGTIHEQLRQEEFRRGRITTSRS